MGGFLGILVGIVLIALGLGGLGVALHEMMSHASPHDALVSIGGLGTFLVSAMLMLLLAR
jgi:hypothetical protein